MSAPGAPPETRYDDEGALPPNSTLTTDLPPDLPDMSGRFRGIPDLFSGVDRPDDRYPQPDADKTFRLSQTDPRLSPDQPVDQPSVQLSKPRSALFNPLPVEQMQPRMGRSDQNVSKDLLFDPRPAEQLPPLKGQMAGGVPDEKQYDGTNSPIGKAVDKALGMQGMHERVNQKDIQQYLTTGGAGMDPAKTAWCAAFVNATLKMAGVEGSGSNIATSFLNKGERVITEPQKGDVVVESRGLAPGQTGGHVGLATGRTRQNPRGGYEFEVLSGNLSDRVGKEWVPAQSVNVRRMASGAPTPMATVTKVPTEQIKGNITPNLTLEEQGQKGFVPLNAPVATPAVHPATGKPILTNPDKTISTEKTITIPGEKGGYVNIPTIVGGVRLSNSEAVKLHVAGKNPAIEGPFKTINEAIGAAKTRSASLAVPEPVATTPTEAAVAAPTLAQPAPGPVYAPAGTPADELTRLSQTKPWFNTKGGKQSWDYNQMQGPLKAVDPHNIGVEEPQQPEMSEDEAMKLLEPHFEEPLYTQPRKFDLLTEPMPISPEDRSGPAQPILRGPMSERLDTVEEPVAVSTPPGFQPDFSPETVPHNLLETEPMPIAYNPSDNAKALQFADTVTRPIRQTAQGAMGQVNKTFYAVGGAATGLLAAPPMAMWPEAYKDNPSPMLKAHQWFQGRFNDADKFNKAFVGLDPAEKPRTDVEKAAELLGESIVPGKTAAYAVATAAIFAVKSFLDDRSPIQFLSPVFAKTKPKKPPDTSAGSGEDAAFTPTVEGHIAAGNLAVGQLFQEINGTVVPLPNGTFKLIPNASMYGNVNLSPEMAIKQYTRTGLNFGTFDSEKAAQDFLAIQNSKVLKKANGATGPEEFKAEDLTAMGLTLAGTVGVALVGKGMSKWTRGNITRDAGRTVENAALGTKAFSNLRDYMTNFIDINRVPGRVAQRAGVPAAEAAEIQEAWAMQTRGGASNLASSAVSDGIAVTPTFTFRVKTPLQQVERGITQHDIDYAAARTSLEEIIAKEGRAQNAAGTTPITPNSVTLRTDPTTGRPYTRSNYEQQIANIEQAHPEVIPRARMINENKRELLRFEEDGEYATITPAEAQRIRVEEPNSIPYGKAVPNETSPAVATARDMHTRMRERLENEAKGSTIDTIRQHEPDAFVPITAEQYRENPHWQPNTVKIYRRGEVEYYTTDPMLARIMNADAHYAKGIAYRVVTEPKRGFESVTTGVFAPAFAWVNFLRSQKIVKEASRTMGWRAPTVGESLLEIPRDLYARAQGTLGSSFDARTGGMLSSLPGLSRFLATQLDRASGGQLTQIFGPYSGAWLDGLGRRLTVAYNQSNHARLKQAGASYGGMFDQQLRHDRVLNNSIIHSTGDLRMFLEGWKAFHGAVHGAPAAASARINMGPMQTRQKWALESRRLTGDPYAGGEFAVGGRVIPFHQSRTRTTSNPLYHAMNSAADFAMLKAAQGVGVTTEVGRLFVPWFNVGVQGMRRVGRAYMDNPVRFTASLFTSQMIPAAASYSWNKYLDKDPWGVSYSDYMMNGRSPYNTMMNFYIGIPGRPASQGIELPGPYHETAIFKRFMEIGMDHAFKSNRYPMKDDFKEYAWNAFKIPFSPGVHPFFNALLATRGQVGPQGLLEGDIYQRRSYAFDQNTGLPVNIDLFARAFGGAAADVIGSGLAAAIQAEGWGAAPGAFLKEAAQRQVERTPVLRNIMGMTPKQAGNTRIVQDMYERQKELKMLDEYYRNWGTTGGNIKLTNKPISAYGGQKAESLLGRPTPLQQPGLKQPEPTNPMYVAVMKEVHNRITKDDIKVGGDGYKSLMQRYSKTTKELRQMYNISHGNHAKWQAHLNSNPEVVEFLEQNNVDKTNRRDVQSFYEQIRQNAAAQILHELRQVETDVGKTLGKPNFRISMLQPYAKPKSIPEWMQINDVIDHLNGMWYANLEDLSKSKP